MAGLIITGVRGEAYGEGIKWESRPGVVILVILYIDAKNGNPNLRYTSVFADMSHSRNSLNGVIYRIIFGEYHGVIQGRLGGWTMAHMGSFPKLESNFEYSLETKRVRNFFRRTNMTRPFKSDFRFISWHLVGPACPV